MDADDKNFVGQPCCDQLLNNIWHDRIEILQTKVHYVKFLISCLTLGLCAPFLLKFRQVEESGKDVVHNVRDSYEMTVNENGDTTDMRQGLIKSTTKK